MPPAKKKPAPTHKVYDALQSTKQHLQNLSSPTQALESGTAPSLSKRGTSTAAHFVPEVIELFPWTAEILEGYLTSAEDSDDPASAITIGQKSILRHALSHPSSFVFIILYIVFPNAPYEQVAENDCQKLYQSFLDCVFLPPSNSNLSPSSSSSHDHHKSPTPVLYKFLSDIQKDKKDLCVLRRRVVQKRPWDCVYVHRFKDEQKLDCGPTPHPSIGKQVVLDCAVKDSFPCDTYHHLQSDDIYRVRPTDNVTPQIHIFASSDPSDGAPSDETIIAMIKAKENWGNGNEAITDQGWYYGAVVYNLFKGDYWLEGRNEKSAAQLALNIEHRRKIIRGKERHGTSGPMVGQGFRADQRGGVNQYSNVIHELDDAGKWELEMASDHCFEFFLTVLKILFPKIVQEWIKEGLSHGVLLAGLKNAAVTGYATQAYCAPIHRDVKDSKWTAGWRCLRGRNEPHEAYQFIFMRLFHESAKMAGVVVEQPDGCIMIWQGGRHIHGSTVNTLTNNTMPSDEPSVSTGMVITQKPLMLSLASNHKLETYAAARLDLIKP